MRRGRVTFFCKIHDPTLLQRVEFYAQDLAILRGLGYEVQVATHPSQLRPSDAYFVWWWTWAFAPVLWARLQRRPVVVTGTLLSAPDEVHSPLRRALYAYALRNADANVFVSRFEQEEVPRRFGAIDAGYVPHCVDVDLYSPGAGEREELIFTVAGSGMNANNSHRKCIEQLIRAAPLVHRDRPRARFVIAGQRGSDYPHLRQVANEVGAGGYIDFPGVISQEEKIAYMRRCQVYLQPTRFEGFGLSVLEAMSCGAPVVSSPRGAIPEVVGDAGVMVDGTDPASIAQGTLRLLEDPALRERLGARARGRAEREFPMQRRRDEIAAVLERVLR